MSFPKYPEFSNLLSRHLIDSESDPSRDPVALKVYLVTFPADRAQALARELSDLAQSGAVKIDLGVVGELGNRWFQDLEEFKSWIESLCEVFESDSGNREEGAAQTQPKDSNGTILQEGDSVVTIKDLKVKGGSSDLKRGTVIKRIHLVDDPEVIECRVDGSTLVLKTCFLKKG